MYLGSKKNCFPREFNSFKAKFGLLSETKVEVAKTQSTNREILASGIISKI